ncbi:MAG: hypothetical protein WCV69_00085 [Patescibacteria group bacterium]|jgi:hypothetical protein
MDNLQNLNNQSPPTNNLPPLNINTTPSANSITSQASMPKSKLNPKIIIILVVVFLLLGGLAYAWFFTGLKDSIPFLNSKKVTNNINIGDSNNASSTDVLMVDYTKKEEQKVLLTCYMYYHPEASQYFPDGSIFGSATTNSLQENNGSTTILKTESDDKSFFAVGSSPEGDEMMSNLCGVYNQDAYDFMLNMLKTDVDQDGLNVYMEDQYHTSDNNVDTDGDGYSDLTEILTNHDPNNLWTLEQNAKNDRLEAIFAQPNFNVAEAVAICKTMGDNNAIDVCLESISRHPGFSEPNYCDTVGFSAGSIYKDWCYDDILFNSGKAEDCIKIDNSTTDFCLAQYVEKEKSLRPCMLLGQDEISMCINPTFKYLDEKSDCDEYKDKMSSDDYNTCLWFIAFNTKDPKVCESSESNKVLTCVNNLAYELLDPNICEYYNPYPDYLKKECIANTPDGRHLDTESGYLTLCKSYSGDYTLDRNKKSDCYAELAKIYNKSEYCKEAANITKIDNAHLYQWSLDTCYYNLIKEKSRTDLCKVVISKDVLNNPEYQTICK